jgi:hypothetical protein
MKKLTRVRVAPLPISQQLIKVNAVLEYYFAHFASCFFAGLQIWGRAENETRFPTD